MATKVNYKVLAIKYRPSSFKDLIGQEALVQTISNGVTLNRVPHAFLLTGTRGVGKTTTARIIAKILNCTKLSTHNNIVEPCNNCENCVSIQENKHPDIIEFDAASKTGVSDIREIIEAANYLPMLAAIKVYIIDEVHMLSTSAFNALLKTLEEPPPHVKFVFATTEIHKIPLTIISRCQRFSLKRVKISLLHEHLKKIAVSEDIDITAEALNLIAIKSEGSVRDSLSLLDMAFNYSQKQQITQELLNEMLGISDRTRLYSLIKHISQGEAEASIKLANNMYDEGINPARVIEDLLEIINQITKVVISSEILNSIMMLEAEKSYTKQLAGKLSITSLTTMWQILLKGIQEIRLAPVDIQAFEMILIKLCYASNLPPLGELINNSNNNKKLDSEIKVNHSMISDAKLPITAQPANASIQIDNFKDLVKLFYTKEEYILHHYLYEDVHLVSFTPGHIVIKLGAEAPSDLISKVTKLLYEWTEEKWIITTAHESENLSLGQQERADMEAHPLVQSVLEQFSGAKITSYENTNN